MPLASELGVRQILWMGAAVPTPAPYEVLQALTRLLSRLGPADRRDLFRIIEKLTHALEDT